MFVWKSVEALPNTFRAKKKNTPHAFTMRGILNDEIHHGKEHWNTIKINLQLGGAY